VPDDLIATTAARSAEIDGNWPGRIADKYRQQHASVLITSRS